MAARTEFAKAVKRAALDRSRYVCEAVNDAGIRCTVEIGRGKPVEFDHVLPDWMGGEATIKNCAALCKVCHKIKTALDAADRSQAKRRSDRHNGITGPHRRLVSRGFSPPVEKPSPCSTPSKLAGLPRNTFTERSR
ncbi:HNH endonuclease [Methylobacterium sp. PvR107]|uniref:HNH endonuclease n=1 Tax=Methylobacterium sp. PvR107 TaxID=2806597 RepID=UPI001AE7A410|nr:HNH endonuclease [Methylobacterium sp. PvR107]MBP1180027.1 5-methylcytosine-specific restriction endonuclease McrA [Methylobacterium sp. PvR107]